MTQWIERAFCFSKKEFLVLLSLGGISHIYSFELPGREELDREEAISLLYGLVKRGFAEVREDEARPVLSRDIGSLLEAVRRAGYALTVMPGNAGVQRIIYLGGSGLALTELTGQKDEIRIREISAGEMKGLLLDSEGLPGMPFETEAEGSRMVRHHLEAGEEWETLKAKTSPALEEPLLSVMEAEQAVCAWELSDLGEQRKLRRALFLEGRVNPWILWQAEGKGEVFIDSLERRENLEKLILREIQEGGETS